MKDGSSRGEGSVGSNAEGKLAVKHHVSTVEMRMEDGMGEREGWEDAEFLNSETERRGTRKIVIETKVCHSLGSRKMERVKVTSERNMARTLRGDVGLCSPRTQRVGIDVVER